MKSSYTDIVSAEQPVPTSTQKSRAWIFVFSLLWIISVIFLALFISVFAEAWGDYHRIQILHLKVEGLRNLMLAAGAAGAVIVGTWGLVLAAVRTHALSRQTQVAETDSKFSEKKHAAEAFATAIEQLGHDKYPVRLGAVYALEALAKSSRDLHGPIFETICAYVRKEAPAPTNDDLTDIIMARGKKTIEQSIDLYLNNVAKPDVVVQAILTVIGRRTLDRDPQAFRLDLQDTDLRKADLRKGHFEMALFNQARLAGANLASSLLNNAVFINAHLDGCYMFEANLSDANLYNASLKGASMYEANLEDTVLFKAQLEGTKLNRAQLNNAVLGNITFDTETDVGSANFKGAKDIPAWPGKNFRSTVIGSNSARWPSVSETEAWDRR